MSCDACCRRSAPQQMSQMNVKLAANEITASCAVLCCAVLCCAVLCCAVLCCASNRKLHMIAAEAVLSSKCLSLLPSLPTFVRRPAQVQTLAAGACLSHLQCVHPDQARAAGQGQVPVEPGLHAQAHHHSQLLEIL